MSDSQAPEPAALSSRPIPPHLQHLVSDAPAPLMNVRRFVKTLVGTDHEVYSKLLLMRHPGHAKSHQDWLNTLENIKVEPAHPLGMA
jgi:hypothetical protein